MNTTTSSRTPISKDWLKVTGTISGGLCTAIASLVRTVGAKSQRGFLMALDDGAVSFQYTLQRYVEREVKLHEDLLATELRLKEFNRQRQAFLALPWYLRVWRALKKEL